MDRSPAAGRAAARRWTTGTSASADSTVPAADPIISPTAASQSSCCQVSCRIAPPASATKVAQRLRREPVQPVSPQHDTAPDIMAGAGISRRQVLIGHYRCVFRRMPAGHSAEIDGCNRRNAQRANVSSSARSLISVNHTAQTYGPLMSLR